MKTNARCTPIRKVGEGNPSLLDELSSKISLISEILKRLWSLTFSITLWRKNSHLGFLVSKNIIFLFPEPSMFKHFTLSVNGNVFFASFNIYLSKPSWAKLESSFLCYHPHTIACIHFLSMGSLTNKILPTPHHRLHRSYIWFHLTVPREQETCLRSSSSKRWS